MTLEQLTETLYDSLRNKIMPLPDDITVYPGHGAGSACGKNMSKETVDTLGHQKATNYALRADMSKTEFVKEVTTGLVPPPGYFPFNVAMNKFGYESIDDVMKRGTHALSPRAFDAAANETDALVLDTRDAQTFSEGFVPNAINIGLDGSFAAWVGALIPDIKQQILIVTEPGREEEVITRLARVGYDYCIGYLDGGFKAWKDAGLDMDTIERITVAELADIVAKDKNTLVFDVRKKSEYDSEHMLDAANAPLDFINESMQSIPKDKTVYVHCAAGYRSMIFSSILRARGYRNLVDVKGGFKEIKESGKFRISEYVCPTTLL
jgi:rhodanese-related sulfurtransferase